MNRRSFLKALAAGLATARALAAANTADLVGKVVTATGPIPPDQMGITLPHEHVLVDFIGADRITPDRYDPNEVFEVVLPYLRQVAQLGCRTLCECTPNFLGRDPVLLRRLARASGLHVLTNTGLYGAANDRYVPRFAYDETAEQLAARWVKEFADGIATTGIRPGFIKIGVDPGRLSDIDRKLVHAAALTHRATGLTIAAHTGNGEAALEQLSVLEQLGVAPSAWIWVHAQNEPDASLHEKAARAGAWVEFDGLSPRTLDRHIALVQNLRSKQLLHRVLVSHDAGWYHVGEPGGGTFRPYTTLFTDFLPRLRELGWTNREIDQLIRVNPREAFTVRLRITSRSSGEPSTTRT